MGAARGVDPVWSEPSREGRGDCFMDTAADTGDTPRRGRAAERLAAAGAAAAACAPFAAAAGWGMDAFLSVTAAEAAACTLAALAMAVRSYRAAD